MVKVSNHKDIFKAIHRSQHCQRNWNLDQTIPQEDIDIILESVTKCPSKQNKRFYDVHVLQDRDMIEKLHKLTYGFSINLDVTTTNSQTLANLVLVFESVFDPLLAKYAYLNRCILNPAVNVNEIDWSNHEYDETLLKHCEQEMKRDEHMAVGVAAGYSNLTASMMGYATGCCACFDKSGVKELLGLKGECLLIMGIGIPGDRPRRVHHLHDDIVFPTKKKEQINTYWR